MKDIPDNTKNYLFDSNLRQQYPLLCGVDEAGRGPLCGPVAVAAVILDPTNLPIGLKDSKKIGEKKRDVLYDEIVNSAIAWSVALVSSQDIDDLNILWATMKGMRQAVETLQISPSYVLIDGNRCPELSDQSILTEPVIKGDMKSASIGAASILAKVTRDRYMQKLDKQFPEYKLAQHKGYPTKLHYELLAQYGIQDFYRLSFLKNRGY